MFFHAQPGIHQDKNSTYKKQGDTSVQNQDQDNGNELYTAHTGIHNIIMDNAHYGPVIDPWARIPDNKFFCYNGTGDFR